MIPVLNMPTYKQSVKCERQTNDWYTLESTSALSNA